MKTKKVTSRKSRHGATHALIPTRSQVTDTTLSEIGMAISKMLDMTNSPKFHNLPFKQIVEQSPNRFSVSASSDNLFINFTVQMKGGKR